MVALGLVQKETKNYCKLSLQIKTNKNNYKLFLKNQQKLFIIIGKNKLLT